MKVLDFPLEIKALADTGEFSGYASIFGNVDQGGDIVERGAFKEMVKTKDGKVLVLYQHSQRDPIGKASVKEDDTGLHVEGKLILGDAMARKAYELMKGGALDGMSIGYDVLPGGAEMTNGGNRKLKALKLWEVSIVTFGMNPLARVDAVKHRAGQLSTIREFEDFLRDEAGFSNAQAKAIAAGGWKALDSARDESERGVAVDQLIERINNLSLPTL